jgi:hypothetical protein
MRLSGSKLPLETLLFVSGSKRKISGRKQFFNCSKKRHTFVTDYSEMDRKYRKRQENTECNKFIKLQGKTKKLRPDAHLRKS